MPLTSLNSSTTRAPTAAPRTTAVRSEPPRGAGAARGETGAAAPERRRIAVRRDSLEARDEGDAALAQHRGQALGAHGGHGRTAMIGGGRDPCLCAREAHGLQTELAEAE